MSDDERLEEVEICKYPGRHRCGCVCVCVWGGGGGGTLLESNTVSSVTLNHFIFPPEPIKLLQSHNLTLDDVVSFEYAPINDMPHLPHLVRGVW